MDQAADGPLTGLPTDERLRAGDLIAELKSWGANTGPNPTPWPGLTVYRFEAPAAPQWDEVRSLSLCVVAQGRKAVTVDDVSYVYDPFNYLVLNRGLRFEAEILEASLEKPFLSFVMQIDPTLVQRISADMRDGAATAFRRPGPLAALPRRTAPAQVSPLDTNTCGAVLRFLQAVTTGPDRRVLAPMYLQEIVYRGHLSEPLSVAELAEQACLSPSAFAHLFRDVCGMSPYQFLKSARLERARDLLVCENLNVSEVARSVGYSSLSHFINEFKRHFGITPRAYADAQRDVVPLRMDLATGRPLRG
jgi:AraC-like DNA-binding protein